MMRLVKLLIIMSLSVSLSNANSPWIPNHQDRPIPLKFLQALDTALPTEPMVESDVKRRILIYSATNGFRHDSIPIGKLALSKMGLSSGAYEAVVSDHPEYFESETLSTFDAVVLLSASGNFFMPSHKLRDTFSQEEWLFLKKRHDRLLNNLMNYVREGGGLVGIHAATDACKKNPAYGDFIGAKFNGHPWTKNMQVNVVVEDPNHAINFSVFEGITDFNIQEEIYEFCNDIFSRERSRILLRLDPKRSEQPLPKHATKRLDNDYAISWVHAYGKGRVFYSSLGDNLHIFTDALILKHYLAGIQFATGDLIADVTPSAQLN